LAKDYLCFINNTIITKLPSVLLTMFVGHEEEHPASNKLSDEELA